MRVILFGATGMVGQGVMRQCVLDRNVEAVLSVVRRATGPALGRRSEKVTELVADNFYDFSAYQDTFAGYDTCFFCLGVSAMGMKADEYRRVAFDITTAAARAMVEARKSSDSASQQTGEAGGMTFVYVSGAGTSVTSRQMWARVKGETENTLLAMPFKAAYMFRPGMIVPMHGIQSKTGWYRTVYAVMRPVLPMLVEAFPKYVTTTEQVGRAMLEVARHGYRKQILESVDIASL
jgi:uncharacterized protein YbjT (DUF2867 family)